MPEREGISWEVYLIAEKDYSTLSWHLGAWHGVYAGSTWAYQSLEGVSKS